MRQLLGRRVLMAVILVVLSEHGRRAMTAYRLPGEWFALAAAAGLGLLVLGVLLVVERVVTATPSRELRPLAAHADTYVLLLVINMIIISFLSPVFLTAAETPLPSPVVQHALATAGALSARALRLVFLMGAGVLAFVALLVVLERTLGRLALFRAAGRLLDRLTATLLLLLFLAGVALTYNGMFDASAPQVRRAEIVAFGGTQLPFPLGQFAWAEVRDRQSRGPAERIVLAPGRDGLSLETTHPGQPILITMGTGWLGMPWVRTITVDHEEHARQVLAALPTAAALRKTVIATLRRERRWQELLAHARAHLQEYPRDRDYVLALASELQAHGQTAESAALARLARP
ncbi:MAG TPA: hypothetical protein VFR64_16340 [Methylomirabilota bacterium]|nr:hypothetical protein [Methylomirabilota bacterium]